ncbi:MAG: tripartite tricarboxylate transporter substrate binding protein [candidate division Zixibacteria bacterium]|nr:tripartite tricarboxylate transporter substrate binding protein [candidate division Zixibacteria bacterium]
MKIFHFFIVVCLVFAFGCAGITPEKGKFPAKDITLICPWSAGGGTDYISRALVRNAKKYFGVNVNVVNKTGGMGTVGMRAVAKARPNGYTVGMITFQLSTYRLMGFANLSYRDYSLIQLINQSPASISVDADSQWTTLKQVMDYAKKNPGIVTAGHSGAGGGWHLALASMAAMNKVKFSYVPFDGAAPTRTALIGGHIDIATTGIDEVFQLYRARKVRILAVNAFERHPLFPKVPTIAEAGFPSPNLVFDWRGLAAPKGVSEDRMKVLVKGFKQCFDSSEFRRLAKELGLPLVYKDPEGFKEFLAGMDKALEPALKSVGLFKAF